MNFLNVLLIDSRVTDYQCFVDSVNENTFPIVYSSITTRNEIMEILNQFTTLDRIGIVNEKYKQFLEGGYVFTEENTVFLTTLIQRFHVKRIDFLACNTLNHPMFNDMYIKLQNDTGVIVGASDNNTGNLKYGGDWVMESTSEDTELIYFTNTIGYYQYLLNVAYFFLVIKTDGFLWGIGDNSAGQLGDGTNTTRTSFVKINLSRSPKSIALGIDHSIVLMTDGSLWGTGSNGGWLGLGNTTNQNTFQLITSGISGRTVKTLSCGAGISLVSMTDGTLWATGANYAGQLGLGNSTTQTTFQQVPIPNGLLADTVVCGVENIMVIMTDGSLWCAGYNGSGHFGIFSRQGYSSLVRSGINNVKTLGCGDHDQGSCIVALADGTLWGAGRSSRVGLNINSFVMRPYFSQITINISGKIAKYVSSTWTITMVLMEDGTIWGTGDNGGQLGLVGQQLTFVQIAQNATGTPKYISLCGPNAFIMMTNGTLWVAGTYAGTTYTTFTQVLSDVSVIPGYMGEVSVSVPTTVSSVSPTIGTTNTNVTINGTSLTNTSTVLFGTVSATNIQVSGTSVQVSAPANSGTVSIVVRDTSGNDVSAGSFTYQNPTVVSMNSNGAPNSTVVINGTYLSNTAYVRFNAINATFTALDNSITVTVPEDTGTAIVYVVDTAGNTSTVPGSFLYKIPTITGTSPDPSYISSICFPSGTLIKSDQGHIPIQKLIKGYHTLHGEEIIAVTETYSMDKVLVCVEKDALRKNCPDAQTFMSPRHKIYYKGKLKAAHRFVKHHKGFTYVHYKGEKLYNVLLNEYGTMNVQGMICETLDPSNPMAKHYRGMEKDILSQ